MLGLRGSFLGFTYNGIHSSIYGITRTINGKYMDKKTLPELKDTTIEIPNGDGQYYYGSVYSKREFSVNFAFEEIDEFQLRQMQQNWNDRQIHPLIFDEEPYKVYSAKITNMITLKQLCFASEENKRVYRGEGSIIFTCYYPFARSRYSYIEDYNVMSIQEWVSDSDENAFEILSGRDRSVGYETSGYYFKEVDNEGATVLYGIDASLSKVSIYSDSTEYVNISEWEAASRIPSKKIYSRWNPETKEYRLFNAGDLQIPFKLYYELPSLPNEAITIELQLNGEVLVLENLKPKRKGEVLDKYLVIDMKEYIIEGCDSFYHRTGNLYNEYIADGSFFLLPKGEASLKSNLPPVKSDLNYLYI